MPGRRDRRFVSTAATGLVAAFCAVACRWDWKEFRGSLPSGPPDGDGGLEEDAGCGAVAPVPPQSPGTGYVPPTNPDRVVTSAADLRSALEDSVAHTVVVADGNYALTAPIVFGASHRVWAQHAGGASLSGGLEIGGSSSNPGGEVHGLVFDGVDPPDPKRMAGGEQFLFIWGGRTNTQVTDCVFHGHGAPGSGIRIDQPDGLVIQRVAIDSFAENGLSLNMFASNQLLDTPARVEDVDVRSIFASPRGSREGKAEVGLWLGSPATVARVRTRDTGYAGVLTFRDCFHAHVTDLDLDQSDSYGLFLSYTTSDSVFERFRVGPQTPVGIATVNDTTTTVQRVVLQNGAVQGSSYGVFLDQGSSTVTVRCSALGAATKGGILDRGDANVHDEANLDFSGLPPGTPHVTR